MFIENLIPENAINVNIVHKGEDKREITITSEEEIELWSQSI